MWPTLYQAGFTSWLLALYKEYDLLDCGYGITKPAVRATNSAAELRKEEFRERARMLAKQLIRYKPHCVAFVGLGA